jgi:KipI family sensor histidine kinase inhibitor
MLWQCSKHYAKPLMLSTEINSMTTSISMINNNVTTSNDFTIEVVSENALLLSWQQQISTTQHNEIIALQALLNLRLATLITESVASYHCLIVYYQFQTISTDALIDKINLIATESANSDDMLVKQQHTSCIQIPVYYDTDQQWDLQEVAQYCGITIEEVIKLHSSTVYRSYALGFTPGFCYLASLPDRLTMARKSSPRTKVPKGAVAIAEQQTAIYPNESPGGWHIIGQTPLPMYQSDNGEFSTAILVGQNVQFYGISKVEFLTLQKSAKS